MCGIAGFVNYSKTMHLNNAEGVLNKMLNRIIHRGPDEMGLFLTGECGMGNVRLSIIDLNSGQQPLANADGSLWISYNGEVYNHIELRKDLVNLGHSFKTHSDTEVVLHMYEEYGEACLNYLNGQFAFSIWDNNKKQLFLARDRVGIRPLFYSQNKNAFVYASEIKCLFEYPDIERRFNLKGLKQSFTFWTTLSPDTVFENVKEVPPGHYLILRDGVMHVKRYWEHAFNLPKFKGGIMDAADELSSILKSSIDLRLRADVQVAAYLSGGLDSSITTSYIKLDNSEILNTFSIGFQDKDFDETYFQNEVASYLNTRHRSVSCSNDDIANLLTKAIWHTEAPLLRTSPIPMMKLSSLVRDNGIKVVLTGEGADEMLGGYNIFKEAVIRQFWAKDPNSKYRPLLLKRLYPYIPQIKNASPAMLRMFFGKRLEDLDSPVYSHALRWDNNSLLIRLMSNEIRNAVIDYNPVEEYIKSLGQKMENYSIFEKAQYIEASLFMSGYLLSSQGDRMAMANSVEGRYPFLDHRLIEFASTLPEDFKLKGLNEKYILKKMIEGQLPQDILKRPKQAYRAPVAHALLQSDNKIIDEYLNPDEIRAVGLFNYDHIEKLMNKLRVNKVVSEVDNMALIFVLSTQILHRLFIRDYTPIPQTDIVKGDLKTI